MIAYTIFIIDDEPTIRQGITLSLSDSYKTASFSTAEEALQKMKQYLPDLILLDIGLPGMNGIEALRKIKKSYPEVLVIMITAYEDIETVISAMKLGAYDYVVKPIHMDSLEVTIRNVLNTIKLRKEIQILQENYLKENLPFFVGESDEIQDVMELISKVAKSPDTPVLIIGETGTGKELVASAVHYRSPNFKGPLISVNCAAIPNELIESELFGYEKGAFSGARSSGKKGLVEEASKGTLFLDEIGDLSLMAQAKLLRFLEEGEFYRVGGTQKICVQTRIVSATNKDLLNMIDDSRFRKDLYFRLGVIRIRIPTLNERRDDIIPLAKRFLVEFGRKFHKKFNCISKEAENALLAHEWIGNVRELKNLIERGALIGNGPELLMEDLGLEKEDIRKDLNKDQPVISFPQLSSENINFPKIQKEFEKYYLEEALRKAHGNESKAAKILNINHHTFRYRRKKLGIN